MRDSSPVFVAQYGTTVPSSSVYISRYPLLAYEYEGTCHLKITICLSLADPFNPELAPIKRAFGRHTLLRLFCAVIALMWYVAGVHRS